MSCQDKQPPPELHNSTIIHSLSMMRAFDLL